MNSDTRAVSSTHSIPLERGEAPQSHHEINARLTTIWEKHSTICGPYVHMHYAIPKTGAIVFVGVNPSFSEPGWKPLLREIQIPELNPVKYFSWPSAANFDIQLSLELEQLARQRHPFYGPHRELNKLLEHPWDHFDLFALRQKSQKAIKSVIFSTPGKLALSEFALAQFEVFETLLTMAKPAAVVVVNALASQIYADQRKPIPDVEAGYYRDSVGMHSFPVLFSGIITGRRPLDRYSKQRLFWQIGKALNKQWSIKQYMSMVAGARRTGD